MAERLVDAVFASLEDDRRRPVTGLPPSGAIRVWPGLLAGCGESATPR